MDKPLGLQIEAGEQSPTSLPFSTPSPLGNTDSISQTPEGYADLDWEIEIIAQRRGDDDKGTKTDGSQGCH